MRPAFALELVNGVFGDPALLVDFRHARRALLFDIGDVGRLPTRKLLRVSDIFVSHAHMDHFAGFDHLLRVCLGRTPGVRIHGPVGIVDRLEHKLAAYTWNVVENYAEEFTVTVQELRDEQHVSLARFRSRQRFEREALGELTVQDGALLSERGLRVRAALLEHGTPCLGFALEESTHVNIWKTGLAELGLPTGPWLQQLKAAILAQAPDSTPIRATWRDRDGPHERVLPLGELRARVVRLVPGQKICYVTDVVYTSANAERIVALAAGADVLYIEAAFAHEDAERAARRYHLTTRQAGELARRAHAALAVPFHFSPRYLGQEPELRTQFEAAFRGET